MNNCFKNKVIVIGYDHHTTLGAIRSLGEMGVNVHAILVRSILNFVGSSKYISGKVTYIDKVDELIPLLAKSVEPDQEKPILLTCADALEQEVDNHATELSTKYLLSGAYGSFGNIARLMDKEYIATVATKFGVLSPKTWVLSTSEQSLDHSLIFPCLCKPLKSASGEPVGGTYMLCQSEEEIVEALAKYKKAGFKELLVEEYIDSDQEISVEGCAFGKDEEPWIPALQIKEKAFRQNNGSTTTALITTDFSSFPEIEQMKSFLKGIGYSGVFDLEYRITPKGAYLLDVNLRVGGCSYGMTKARANIIYAWCHYVATGAKPQLSESLRQCHFFNEFFYIFDVKRGLSKHRELFVDIFKRNAYAVFNLRDTKPFIKRIKSKLSR